MLGGKSGLQGQGWSLTATGSDPKESAAEKKTPRIGLGRI